MVSRLPLNNAVLLVIDFDFGGVTRPRNGRSGGMIVRASVISGL